MLNALVIVLDFLLVMSNVPVLTAIVPVIVMVEVTLGGSMLTLQLLSCGVLVRTSVRVIRCLEHSMLMVMNWLNVMLIVVLMIELWMS